MKKKNKKETKAVNEMGTAWTLRRSMGVPACALFVCAHERVA
jgi:hypothetical protein